MIRTSTRPDWAKSAMAMVTLAQAHLAREVDRYELAAEFSELGPLHWQAVRRWLLESTWWESVADDRGAWPIGGIDSVRLHARARAVVARYSDEFGDLAARAAR